MPKIPTFKSEAVLPVPSIDPSTFSAPARADAEAGAGLAKLGVQGADVFSRINAANKKATRNLLASEVERDFLTDIDTMVESYRDRTDAENFEEDMQKGLSDLSSQYSERIGGDTVVQAAFNNAFSLESRKALGAIRTKRADVMTKRDQAAFDAHTKRALQEYADTEDPAQRDLILATMQQRIAIRADSGFIDDVEAGALADAFADEAEILRVDRMIEVDPTAAKAALKNDEFALDPTLEQEKIEEAITQERAFKAAAKVAEEDAKKKEKEALKVAHDTEENSVADLFLAGDYSAVIPFLTTADNIPGNEKKTWAEAANKNAKLGREGDSKEIQAAEIVKINRMISTGVDPATIRNKIVTGPLSVENKEQYVNKVETTVKAEIDRGRREGYALIQGLIIPKRGQLTNLLETPLETAAVASAQIGLDDWLDAENDAGRTPTLQEIKRKSIELGRDNQVPLAQQIRFMQEEAELQAQQAAEALEE